MFLTHYSLFIIKKDHNLLFIVVIVDVVVVFRILEGRALECYDLFVFSVIILLIDVNNLTLLVEFFLVSL